MLKRGEVRYEMKETLGPRLAKKGTEIASPFILSPSLSSLLDSPSLLTLLAQYCSAIRLFLRLLGCSLSVRAERINE